MHKLSAMIIDKDSLKVTAREGDASFEEFKEAFDKTLPLTIKVEIKYNAIKEIRKGLKSNDISISHKAFAGIMSLCQFEFYRQEDAYEFTDYFLNEKKFKKTIVKLSPLRYVWFYLLCLIPTVFIAVMVYFAMDVGDSITEELRNKVGLDYFIDKLGETGVLAVIAVVTVYFANKIWKNFKNPAHQLVLTPPDNL